MTLDQKTKLLALIMAVMDGRDPRMHVEKFDAADCEDGHQVLRRADALLKAQWVLLGSPEHYPVG